MSPEVGLLLLSQHVETHYAMRLMTEFPSVRSRKRERSVLALMAQGRSNRAHSGELCLNAKTVEAHVHSIFTKLNLPPDAGDHRRVLAVLAFLRS